MRIAEVDGRTVRIIRQARKNSRVKPINPTRGEETGEPDFLVESSRLKKARYFDPRQNMAHVSHTVRLSEDTMSRLRKEAHPFETPDDVIRRLLAWK